MVINDEILSDESQNAPSVNEYFSKVGNELDQQLPEHTNPTPVRQNFPS